MKICQVKNVFSSFEILVALPVEFAEAKANIFDVETTVVIDMGAPGCDFEFANVFAGNVIALAGLLTEGTDLAGSSTRAFNCIPSETMLIGGDAASLEASIRVES